MYYIGVEYDLYILPFLIHSLEGCVEWLFHTVTQIF